MRRRRGRPGLVGTVARTAVIAGTANAVTGGMQRSRQEQAVAQQNAAAVQQQQMVDQAAAQAAAQMQAAQPAPAPAAAPAGNDTIAQLQQLGDMHAQGLLNADEFTAAKAKLLGT